LQEGEVEPLGGERTVKVDVRVLAATHRPLEAMVARGTFRADLFYRLFVFPIEIPPLRERLEDLPALASHVLGRIARGLGCVPPVLGAPLLARLLAHPWPGNVRELANVLERALILGKGERLVLDELGLPAAPIRRARAPRLAATLEQT